MILTSGSELEIPTAITGRISDETLSDCMTLILSPPYSAGIQRSREIEYPHLHQPHLLIAFAFCRLLSLSPICCRCRKHIRGTRIGRHDQAIRARDKSAKYMLRAPREGIEYQFTQDYGLCDCDCVSSFSLTQRDIEKLQLRFSLPHLCEP